MKSSTLLHRSVSWSLFVFALFSSFFLYQLFHLKTEDLAWYQKYLEKKEEKKTMASSGHQFREGVQKDLWVCEENNRLHWKIVSDSSLLTLVPKNEKLDIIENLNHLHTWMQDKIYTGQETSQEVRYLEAKEGTYRYFDQQFVADSVFLSLQRLPGTVLPTTFSPSLSYLKGIAHDVSFSLMGKNPHFQAHQFQATLTKE